MRMLTLVCAVVVAVPAGAAEDDSKSIFLKHWQVAKEFTLAVAEARPAESYDFKPNPEELAFGYLMTHIADDNSTMCARVARTKPLTRPPLYDKQTAIAFLNESFDKCSKEIGALTPEQWSREVYKFKDQPVVAHEALLYTFTHMAHHRGQAEVYLRMKNIKPPGWQF
jgi:uncharacterized damage-inducible protein DinB